MDQRKLVSLLINRKLSAKEIFSKKFPKKGVPLISSVKEFKGEQFYNYEKGNVSNFIVARNKNVLFQPLVDFKINNIQVHDQEMRVNFSYDEEYNSIFDVKLVLGEERKYPLEVRQSDIFFDIGLFKNILINNVPNLEVHFISKIDNNRYSCYIPLPYKIVPKFEVKGLYFTKSKGKNLHIFINEYDSAKIKEIKEHLILEEKPIILKGINGQGIEELKEELAVYEYAGYIFVALDRGILEVKDRKYYNKRINFMPFRRKVVLWFLRNTYNILGYDRYEWLRAFFRKVKKIWTPYLYYINNYEKLKVEDNIVLIESSLGNDLSGSMFALAQELENYNLEVYVTAVNIIKFKKIKANYDLNFKIVKKGSRGYYKIMAKAKYLLNDATFPPHYIKKEEQIYINTWHGIPLKKMGKQIEYSKLELANTQRNFLQSSKVVLRSNYAINIFSEDYMVDQDKFKLMGAPKMDLLLQDADKKSDRLKIVWMPTWRGVWDDLASQQINLDILDKVKDITQRFKNIDIYYKPHQHIYKLIEDNIADYKDVKFVPEGEEIYSFLSDADVLITDYSSIMFDFAVLNKPIILDCFDIDNYMQDRGLYIEIDELPFEKVSNYQELVSVLNNIQKVNSNYSEFNKIYNSLEVGTSSKDILEYMLNFKAEEPKKSDRVLIYPGSMLTNGITTSFLNLLNNLNDFDKDMYVHLPVNVVKPNYENVMKIPDKFKYIASVGGVIQTDAETIIYRKFNNRIKLSDPEKKVLKEVFEREIKRVFYNLDFNYVIHFPGYEAYIADMFKNMDSKKIIYIHNDMAKEYELRENFNYFSIKGFCDIADLIRPVNNRLSQIIKESPLIEESQEDKVVTAHNLVDEKNVLDSAKKHEEYMTDELMDVLNDNNIVKFINIARFSPEKGLPRLIEAFLVVQKKNPKQKMKLILVGAHGTDSQRILNQASNDILVFSNINPFPILKRSDLFVLSSYHEGLPMVFFEAITLGVPILSTNISGPKEFLEQGYGNLCENSKEGIINGMQMYLDGKLLKNTKSLDEFNKNAYEEFLLNFR